MSQVPNCAVCRSSRAVAPVPFDYSPDWECFESAGGCGAVSWGGTNWSGGIATVTVAEEE